MSCIDTCVIGNYDGDSPDCYYETHLRRSRKAVTCAECREVIPVGEPYEKIVGSWDGDVSTYRTCALCQEIRQYFSCGAGWCFGQVWEDIAESIFGELTFECLDGDDEKPALSVAAKLKVLARWRRWKGLE